MTEIALIIKLLDMVHDGVLTFSVVSEEEVYFTKGARYEQS